MKSILILLILVFSRPAKAEEFSQIWLGKDLWPFGSSKYPGGSEYKSSGNWRSMPGVILGFHYGGKGPLPKPVELSIPLKKPLPLGSYRLFIKNFYRGRMEATVGDITRPLTIRRYDWTPGVTFESNAPIDRIVLRYFPDGTGGVVPETGAKQERYYIVQGLFLTTANNKVPVREGEIISMLPLELPPIVDGNLIANASFEAGIHPWGKVFGSQHFITHEYLDETDGAVGKASLRFRKRKSFGLETPHSLQVLLVRGSFGLLPGFRRPRIEGAQNLADTFIELF